MAEYIQEIKALTKAKLNVKFYTLFYQVLIKLESMSL